MNIRTSTGLALILGLGLALPAAAQQAAEALEADADEDGFVNSAEAAAHDESRFEELAEGGDEITLEQFRAGIVGAEAVGAEAETAWDPETEFGEADTDESGAVDREEWMEWRQQRFEQAAGAEGRVEVGLYRSIDSSGAMAGVGGGGEGAAGVTVRDEEIPTGADTAGEEDEAGDPTDSAQPDDEPAGSDDAMGDDAGAVDDDGADAGGGEGAGDTTTEDASGETTFGDDAATDDATTDDGVTGN